MRIGILRIGQTDNDIIDRIRENLCSVFAKAECILIDEALPTPQHAFNEAREQYRSNTILSMIRTNAEQHGTHDRILGVVDLDLYIPRLNFVFGQAECPGKAALISLWRLRPEFYRKPSDPDLFTDRATKEAVHELGHTLGLRHCSNPFCVMYFSNSIFETDRKQSLFCNKCFLKAQSAIDGMK